MVDCDVLVIGGGVSGTSFAHHAARAGRGVLLVEREPRVGGCLASERTPSGYWYELGAHTAYNSYGAFLELIEGVGLAGALQRRAKPVLRFLKDGGVAPGSNALALLAQFGKLELLRSLPSWFKKDGPDATVRERFTRYVGARNYARVLGPMLSAVPSQRADDMPASALFKKRPRRDDMPRSFTLDGGLRAVPESVVRQPGIDLLLGRAATGIARDGATWRVRFDDGSQVSASLLALALPPQAAAGLLREVEPELASMAAEVEEVELVSLGLVLPRTALRLAEATFLIPLEDSFHSVVTRDVVPDPDLRAFTFHFKPGLDAKQRVQRALSILGVHESDVEHRAERAGTLPALRRGHAQKVAGLDRALAGRNLALTGNWFEGLSIEDCALRSRAEWQRCGTRDS